MEAGQPIRRPFLFIAGVQVRENGDLDKDDISKNEEKWRDSRCILKLESIGRIY